MSISNERFELKMRGLEELGFSDEAEQLRERDAAQREALARVESERDFLSRDGENTRLHANHLHTQLAKAVGLLEKVTETTGWDLRDGPLISQVHDFLLPHREAALMKDKGGRHAQAEQQEAQGAQAGDEREAFDKWRYEQADSLRRCGYPDGAQAFLNLGSVQWAGWQARAALATQPAAGEPVATWVALTAAGQLRKGDKIRFRFGQETLTETVALVLDAGTEREEVVYNRKRNFYFITSKALAGTSSAKEVEVLRTMAAPPAAAHGDSASEQHRNNMADTIVSLRTEIAALRRNAAAHEGEAVRIDARLLELYQAPFRFDERGGYIWDAQNNMVADNHVDGDQAMRVRGWGRLSYRQDGEEVQDLMGQAMADALTARWEAAMRAQAGEGGEV